MSLYRKKPITIQAWRWVFAAGQPEAPVWITNALAIWPKENGIAFWPDGSFDDDDGEWASKPHMAIKTLEGVMRAQPGDWIIRGVQGELYPCKPAIFEASYEPA